MATPPTQTVRDCLACAVKGLDCFCKLSPETLSALQTLGSFESVPEGTMVLHEGFSGERLYVVCRGRVKLSASSAEGKMLLLRVAGPGDVLGLSSVLRGTPHKVTAETLEPCEMKSIAREEFLAFMDRYRDASRNSALTMALEYEGAMLSARRLALSGSAPAKLAGVLLDWGRMGGERMGDEHSGDGHANGAGAPISFKMPLTHEELGNMAGLSRETVTRTLTKFRTEGLLEQKGDVMTLVNPASFERRYCE